MFLRDIMVLKILLVASVYILTIYGGLLLLKYVIDQQTNKLQP